jgi:hypothetical protein
MESKMSTFKEPIDLVIVEDFPNSCPFDGIRTEELESRDDYIIEKCPHCNKLFNFWIE